MHFWRLVYCCVAKIKKILNPVTIWQYQNKALFLGVVGRFTLLTFSICFCQPDLEKAWDYHCVPVTLSSPAPGYWNVLTRPRYSPAPFSRKVMHSVWATMLICGLKASLTWACEEVFHWRHSFRKCWWRGHFFFYAYWSAYAPAEGHCGYSLRHSVFCPVCHIRHDIWHIHFGPLLILVDVSKMLSGCMWPLAVLL